MLKTITFFLLSLCTLSNSFLQAMTNDEFAVWWKGYRDTKGIPHELREMEDYFVSSGLLLQHSSNYWNHLNQKNIQQITTSGYQNFKQTVSQNYFTWVVSIDHPYASNLKKLVPRRKEKLPSSEINKVHPFFGKAESILYNQITEYFINYILKIGMSAKLNLVEEPLIGNPAYVTFKGKRVSQDILNSLLEYNAVDKHCKLSKVKTILEVGAGSGRTAFCFMTLLPKVKYIIVDFPPALYVSQTYLRDVFPNRKVMHFRPFNTFSDISAEFSKADLVFLTPDQIEKLPDGSVDLFLAIDCLHEMKPQSIDRYFAQADRLSSFMYYKCWQKTTVPYDGVFYSAESYPVRPNWMKKFVEPCVVPSDFFHALYQIK